VALRAFLPLVSAIEQTQLHSYNVEALVPDGWVICAPPTFTSVRVDPISSTHRKNTGGQGSAQYYSSITMPARGVPFDCSASLPLVPEEQLGTNPQIPLTLCL